MPQEIVAPAAGATLYGPKRSRSAVQADIDAHVRARDAHARAVAWTIAAEAEGLPAANIEQARSDTAALYEEMQEAARRLLTCMPTDPKGLVDLLLYLEKNFSVLPPELAQPGGAGQSLAFFLLRTVRISLREIAKYGKFGPSS